MKGEGIVFLLLIVVFMFSFVSSDSTAQTTVHNLGCSVDGDSYFSIGSCSAQKWYYCFADGDKWDVVEVPNACSKDASPINSDNVCCPSGYYCTELSKSESPGEKGEGYYCVLATDDCSSYDDETECEDHAGQCFWDGVCVDVVDNCYDYPNKENCNNDAQDAAPGDVNCRHGEVMSGGVPYVIQEDSCECVWDDDENSCGLNYDIRTSWDYGGSSDFPECKYTLDEPGDCIDGYESYKYVGSLSDGGDLNEGDARCFNRTGRRRCGESIVKVPFFSLFNVVVFGFLIGLFYFFRVLNKNGGRVE